MQTFTCSAWVVYNNGGTFKEVWGFVQLAWGPRMLPLCLVCLESFWINLWKSTCKRDKWKWQSWLGVLQSVSKAWDSLYGCYGVCMKWFWPRRTNGLSWPNQNAAGTLFCNKTVILWMRRFELWLIRVLGQLGHVKSVCKVSFGWFLQEWEIVVSFPVFFYLKQENASFKTDMSNALNYAAPLVLDQSDLCTKF